MFSMPLILYKVFPSSFFIVALYGLSQAAGVTFLSPLFSRAISFGHRLNVITKAIICEGFAVAVSLLGTSLCLAAKGLPPSLWSDETITSTGEDLPPRDPNFDPLGSEEWASLGLWDQVGLVCGLACVVGAAAALELCTSIRNQAVKRDWTPELINATGPKDNPDELAYFSSKVNARIQRVELINELFGPVLGGVVLTYCGTRTSVILVALVNVASFGLELVILRHLYFSYHEVLYRDGLDLGSPATNSARLSASLGLYRGQSNAEAALNDRNGDAGTAPTSVAGGGASEEKEREKEATKNFKEGEKEVQEEAEKEEVQVWPEASGSYAETATLEESGVGSAKAKSKPKVQVGTVDLESQAEESGGLRSPLLGVRSSEGGDRIGNGDPEPPPLSGPAQRSGDGGIGLQKWSRRWRKAYTVFVRHRVAPMVFAIAFLYFNVMSPAGGMFTVFLKSLGVNETVIAGVRASGAVFGLLGTLVFPHISHRFGCARASLYCLLLLCVCLSVALVLLETTLHPALTGGEGAVPIGWLLTFLGCVVISRGGLYAFDVGESQTVQSVVEAKYRGEVSSCEGSLISGMTLVSFVACSFFSTREQFPVLCGITVTACLLSLFLVSGFVSREGDRVQQQQQEEQQEEPVARRIDPASARVSEETGGDAGGCCSGCCS